MPSRCPSDHTAIRAHIAHSGIGSSRRGSDSSDPDIDRHDPGNHYEQWRCYDDRSWRQRDADGIGERRSKEPERRASGVLRCHGQHLHRYSPVRPGAVDHGRNRKVEVPYRYREPQLQGRFSWNEWIRGKHVCSVSPDRDGIGRPPGYIDDNCADRKLGRVRPHGDRNRSGADGGAYRVRVLSGHEPRKLRGGNADARSGGCRYRLAESAGNQFKWDQDRTCGRP